MSDLKPGDRVSITIEEAIVTNTYTTGRKAIGSPLVDTGTVLVFQHPGETRMDRNHTVNMGAPGVTVTRISPPEWPPQHNDVWKDRDGLNWVANAEINDVELFSVIGSYFPDDLAAKYGPLSLVHREVSG